MGASEETVDGESEEEEGDELCDYCMTSGHKDVTTWNGNTICAECLAAKEMAGETELNGD